MNNVSIKYDIEKDIENFFIVSRSINSLKTTKLNKEYQDIYGEDVNEVKVKEFLQSKINDFSTNFEKKSKDFETLWAPLEKSFFAKCEELFDIKIPVPITGYITLNERCGYNWEKSYFFVSYFSKQPTATIMHELLHFYTHRKFENDFTDKRSFNEIKEALTVLLNTEFKELMGEFVDLGYEQHQDLRKEILKMRESGMSVSEIINIYKETKK